MRNMAASACVLCGLFAGSSMLAAPGAGPQNTLRAGDPTPPYVLVQNTPLPVAIATMPPVTLSGTTIETRLHRQEWEYRVLHLAADQDPMPALATAGTDGWEAIGAQFQTASGVVILLKRPR